MIDNEKLDEFIKIIKLLPISDERKENAFVDIKIIKNHMNSITDKLMDEVNDEKVVIDVFGGIHQKSFEKRLMETMNDPEFNMENENNMLSLITESLADVFRTYDMNDEGDELSEKLIKILKLTVEFKELFGD